MSSRQKGRRLTTVRYYLSSVRCRFKCPIDELAALREDAAEIVTTGRRTRGKRVDPRYIAQWIAVITMLR